MANKPAKIEQKNESPDYSTHTGKKFQLRRYSRKVWPGLEPLTLNCQGDVVTSRQSGNEPEKC